MIGRTEDGMATEMEVVGYAHLLASDRYHMPSLSPMTLSMLIDSSNWLMEMNRTIRPCAACVTVQTIATKKLNCTSAKMDRLTSGINTTSGK